MSCGKCGLKAAQANLRRVTLPTGDLRLCALCWDHFWTWMAGRAIHTHSGCTMTRAREGLYVCLCVLCFCQFDRWLKPPYPKASLQNSDPGIGRSEPRGKVRETTLSGSIPIPFPLGGSAMSSMPRKSRGQVKPAPAPAPKTATPAQPAAPQAPEQSVAPAPPAPLSVGTEKQGAEKKS